MLSTGKTAWCVWAPLALLALLPLSLTQAQTQGKSLLISLLLGDPTTEPALADVQVGSVQNITCSHMISAACSPIGAIWQQGLASKPRSVKQCDRNSNTYQHLLHRIKR